MTFIGLDLGATFLKAALLEVEGPRLREVTRVPFPGGHADGGAPGPVDPEAVVALVSGALERLAAQAPQGVAGVLLCAQMHGVVLAGPDGAALGPFRSWQDPLSKQPHPSGRGSHFEALEARLGPAERAALKGELKPGYPAATLFALAERGELPAGAVPCALPDFVAARLCGAPPRTERTMAASTGAYHLEAGGWHPGVLAAAGLGGLRWPPIVGWDQVVGRCRLGGRPVPVYAAVGDQQAALLGAFLGDGELSLNVATGSQVSCLAATPGSGACQVRPFFGPRWLKTITHVPAGRALNALLALLGELAAAEGVTLRDPWGAAQRAAEAVADAGGLEADLAFYPGALGDAGALRNLREENLTVGHLFRAAFERMAEGYALLAPRLAPEAPLTSVVWSGGLAQKTPLLRRLAEARLALPARVGRCPEDTLLGLLSLARVLAGRASDPLAAAAEGRALERAGHAWVA